MTPLLCVPFRLQLSYNTFKSTIKDAIMTISANEVKTKGVTLFAQLLEKFDELVINVRGKDKFVVIDIERYKELRAHELDAAYLQTMQEIQEGRFKTQSAKEHIQELINDL